MPDLDQFLSDSVPASEPAPEPEPTPAAVETVAPATEGVQSEPPAPQLPPRGEDGKWKKREDHAVPLEALLAEREKRQAAERALEERRAAEPLPDVWADPAAFVEAKVKEAESRLLTEADNRAEVKARQLFLHYTETAARARYADYDQMRTVFQEEAQRNPVLATQLRDAPDPADFIYRQGKTAAELRDVGGDLSAYRKRIESEIRQKVEREMAARAPSALPQSLNTEPSRGAGIQGSPGWAGPTPLEDILPTKRQ